MCFSIGARVSATLGSTTGPENCFKGPPPAGCVRFTADGVKIVFPYRRHGREGPFVAVHIVSSTTGRCRFIRSSRVGTRVYLATDTLPASGRDEIEIPNLTQALARWPVTLSWPGTPRVFRLRFLLAHSRATRYRDSLPTTFHHRRHAPFLNV